MSELFTVDFPSGSTLIRDNLPSAKSWHFGWLLERDSNGVYSHFSIFLNGFLVRLNASRRQRANT